MNDELEKNAEQQAISSPVEPIVRRFVWVVYNINGDVIGVADSFGGALLIYENRYNDTPDNADERIHKFELNKMQYA